MAVKELRDLMDAIAHVEIHKCDQRFADASVAARKFLAGYDKGEPPIERTPMALTFTLREAEELLHLFGGEQAEITVRKLPAGAVKDDPYDPGYEGQSPAGLWGHFTDMPEEGCWYLGPVDPLEDYEPTYKGEPYIERTTMNIRCDKHERYFDSHTGEGCPQCAEPVAHEDLMAAADETVRASPLWKRFIDGTPLSNDIAVWMVRFAHEWAARIAKRANSAERMNDLRPTEVPNDGTRQMAPAVARPCEYPDCLGKICTVAGDGLPERCEIYAGVHREVVNAHPAPAVQCEACRIIGPLAACSNCPKPAAQAERSTTTDGDGQLGNDARSAAGESRQPACDGQMLPPPSTPSTAELSDEEKPKRDAWVGGNSYEASMLRNLLARIHGDGGHYLEEHGLEKALDDADQLVAEWRAGRATVAEDAEHSDMRRFVMYRRNLEAQGKHDANQKAPNDAVQFEGVVFHDGSVAVRWRTPIRSTSTWTCMDDLLKIHGHPEYGSEIVWLDAARGKP